VAAPNDLDISAAAARFLRLPEVKQITGLPRSTIYDKMQRGEFPSSINLGGRTVAWISGEIQDWVAQRIKASRNLAGNESAVPAPRGNSIAAGYPG
jgi:prophage regulatory protein